MNSTHTLPALVASRTSRPLPAPPATVQERLQSRFALRVASRLTEASETLPSDVAERLRHSREQALLRARSARAAMADSPVRQRRGHTASLGNRRSGWRLKFAVVIPGLALAGGLLLIQAWQDSAQVSVAAEIDAALLSDDVPPTAYTDDGFVQYLKTPGE